MDSQKNKWDAMAEGLAVCIAKLLQDKNNTAGKDLPSIVVYLDPLTAMQLLVTTRRHHDFKNLELSVTLMGILEDLAKHYPEIEHLLKDASLSDQVKIEKSKMIFGIEP